MQARPALGALAVILAAPAAVMRVLATISAVLTTG
jgi:hypothetical protein